MSKENEYEGFRINSYLKNRIEEVSNEQFNSKSEAIRYAIRKTFVENNGDSE